jgi:hypothetical protein
MLISSLKLLPVQELVLEMKEFCRHLFHGRNGSLQPESALPKRPEQPKVTYEQLERRWQLWCCDRV